jgi:hypothetical protein
MSRDVMELFAALSIEAMPTEAHREALRRRRRETQRELRIAEGRAPIAGRARRIRDTAGRARQRIGMGVTWYERAPDEVAAALRAAPASVE